MLIFPDSFSLTYLSPVLIPTGTVCLIPGWSLFGGTGRVFNPRLGKTFCQELATSVAFSTGCTLKQHVSQ